MEYREVELTVVPPVGFKVDKPVTEWITVYMMLYGFTAREISVDTQRRIVEALRIGILPQF